MPVPYRRSIVNDAAAEVLIGLPGRVGIRHAIERIEARRRISEIGRNLRILPISRRHRRCKASDQDLRLARWPLTCVVVRQADPRLLRRSEQHLPANAEIVSPFTSSPVTTLRIVPSRVVPENDTRPATFLDSAPVTDALACTMPRLPTLSSTSLSVVKRGRFVVTLTAPAVVFFPNSVPCGPRSTSTRSTSRKSSVAAAGRAKNVPSSRDRRRARCHRSSNQTVRQGRGC